jgi:hypothetical protein
MASNMALHPEMPAGSIIERRGAEGAGFPHSGNLFANTVPTRGLWPDP